MTAAAEDLGDDVVRDTQVAPAMSRLEIDAVFEAFVSAFRRRDDAALSAVWTPDVRAWHSVDRHAKDAGEYLAFINALPPMETRVLALRRDYLPDGFVQQHTIEITRPDGRIDEDTICLVVKMRDGLICRIDEYITGSTQNG